MKLAFFSPLNPERSGISDYSEEILPYLAQHADIDLVVGDYQPTTPAVRDRFRILRSEEFLRHKAGYDAVIYQIGNSYRYHAYMMRCLREAPGIVVLHDYSLSYLMLGLTVERGDYRTLRNILAPDDGVAPLDILLSRIDPYEVSLARPVIEMSTGVIVHNNFARQRLLDRYPNKPVQVIWHATPIRERLGDKRELREKYGFGPEDFLLASVSNVAYNKRFEVVVRVLHRLVQEVPSARLLVVSGGQFGAKVEALIRRLGLGRHVIRTGWVSAEQYLDYIDLCDAVIDLRHPTAGETSGSSLRVLQAGKPIVATPQGFFPELPDDCWISVPPDENEEMSAFRAVLRLARDRDLAHRMGSAGRAFTLAHLRREQAAEGYIRFARERESAATPEGVVPWSFVDAGRGGVEAALVKSVFRASRVGYFHRHYGTVETIRRTFSGLLQQLSGHGQ